MKYRQPVLRRVTDLRADRIEQLNVIRGARQDIEHVAEPGKVEPADGRAVSLLDEEKPAVLAEIAHNVEFGLTQLEAVHVVVVVGARVRQEDERRGLLDERARN